MLVVICRMVILYSILAYAVGAGLSWAQEKLISKAHPYLNPAVDLAVGFGAVKLFLLLVHPSPIDFPVLSTTMIFLILGRLFPVLFRIKGADGVMLVGGIVMAINPVVIMAFVGMFAIGYFAVSKERAVAVSAGILGATLVIASLRSELVLKMVQVPCAVSTHHTLFVIVLGILLFSRQVAPVRTLLQEGKLFAPPPNE